MKKLALGVCILTGSLAIFLLIHSVLPKEYYFFSDVIMQNINTYVCGFALGLLCHGYLTDE